MPLSAFTFPFPETRFFKAGSLVYKFKIRGGSSYSGEEVIGDNRFKKELEEIIRTVLGNLDSLQPFSSPHFTVFPCILHSAFNPSFIIPCFFYPPDKKPLEEESQVICNQRDIVFPFEIFLFLEKNMKKGKSAEENWRSLEEAVLEPCSKRCKTDSPLDEAILKDLSNDFEAERRILSSE
ncbi:uncharacterized protein majin [Halichoeres trimaculatus]|uniref:uncharacterized protein majin n=1 Tax=Halichoeres trimaculatus TaxID=147232 RepID=UPI003D9F4352